MKIHWLMLYLLLGPACGAMTRANTTPAGVASDDTSKPWSGDSGLDWNGMDSRVAPGDDFYAHANGGWLRNTPIPADRSFHGVDQTLQELSIERTRLIIEEASKTRGSKPGDFYVSFVDEATIQARGLEPVKPWMKAIAGTATREALAIEMAKLARHDIGGLFVPDVGRDDKNPDVYVASLRQSGLGLPDRALYLEEDARLASIRTAYRAYLTKMLTLAGERDADERAAAVFAFETALAEAHWTRADARDAEKTYNRWSLADFEQKAPGFPWRDYFAALELPSQPAYIAQQPSAFAGEARVFASTALPVLKDYLMLRMLSSYARYLSRPFEETRFAFYGTTLAGTPEQQPRARRAVMLVSNFMGDAVGREYVARHFPPRARAQVEAMVQNVIAAMGDRLERLDWMAPETKARARAKLANVRVKIGHPNTWRDYTALEIEPDDLVGNVARANAFEYRRRVGQLGRPVDRDEWLSPVTAANAFAHMTANEIIFPAAILQPPYFDPNADPAVNHGGIGVTIGHELSHLFDDQGRKFDASGRLAEWWTPRDVERFTALTDKLVAQYDAYEPIPGQHIQGALTLGENLADLAGLAVAYDAYHRSLGGKPAPVIGGTTGEQRFFLGHAQSRRSKHREPALSARLLSDAHAPARERVWTVRNLDSWYAAYQVGPDQKLYLAPEDRVRIW
ncbi:peptidase M13 [Cystobacter fuscus]|uniref:Peptidase M13 n=1 Tax=Cystobacter fuscus TaxID=43 RepID=A0A250J961_9BACT|nr:M13 family metallopeptidase [Cystobacter fuscus]ATB40123.1 peptidase M13 [Cystobacter fuscus]